MHVAQLRQAAASADEVARTGRDRQREETRRRVREHALDAFRRDGLPATKIDDIVRAARVSRGTFYFHFPTKEDVIVEVLGEAESRIAAAVARLPPSTPLRRVLELTCDKIAEEWEDDPRLFPDVGAVAVRRAAGSFREGHRDPVSVALAGALRTAAGRKELTDHLSAEVLADFFLINAFAAALSWCAHPKTPLRAVLAVVVTIFLDGAGAVRKRPASRASRKPNR